MITWRGHERSVGYWARRFGLLRNTVQRRLDRGWPLDRALLTPPGGYGPAIESHLDLLDDVLAGESSARVLAMHYEVTERTIHRIRARLRAAGRRVRVPG